MYMHVRIDARIAIDGILRRNSRYQNVTREKNFTAGSHATPKLE